MEIHKDVVQCCRKDCHNNCVHETIYCESHLQYAISHSIDGNSYFHHMRCKYPECQKMAALRRCTCEDHVCQGITNCENALIKLIILN